ncbi:MAG: VWA domain-containing protein [Candidatus Nanohaloarchaeota archaeon]|nr:VWA domain-containing protein [Candidatus Nanohaloarchaeota archaeon]
MVVFELSNGTKIVLDIAHKNLAVILVMLTFIIHLFVLKKIRERTIKFANYETLKRVIGYEILRSNFLPLLLRILAILFFILAISNFSISIIKPVNDVDFVIALDVSQSMLQSDGGNFTPNRLEVAKRKGIEVLRVLPEQTLVGLVSFSGKAWVEHPLTADHNSVAEALKSLHSKPPAGTAIGDALISSAMLLSNSSKQKKAIILITDGKQTENTGVDLEEAVKYVKQQHIKVNVIGIGRKNDTIIKLEDINISELNLPENLKKEILEKNKTYVLPAELDEEALMQLANETQGKYFYATNETDIGKAYTEAILKFNAVNIDARRYALYLGLVFLFLEWLLGATKYKTIP